MNIRHKRPFLSFVVKTFDESNPVPLCKEGCALADWMNNPFSHILHVEDVMVVVTAERAKHHWKELEAAVGSIS